MKNEAGDPIPRNFQQWRHCIEHWCGIELTPDYVDQRLRALEDPNDHHTTQFIKCYGRPHHAAVLGWFRQWQNEQGGD